MLTKTLLIFIFTATQAVKLPEIFKRCKVSTELDNKPNECLKIAIEDAVHSLSTNGNQELGIFDIDPLKIEKMIIDKGSGGSVDVKIEYTDNDLIGLSNTIIKSVNGKLSGPEGFEMIVISYNDQLRQKGPYNVDGKALILPIKGAGEADLIFKNVTCKLSLKGEPMKKNGKLYLKINNFKFEIIQIGRIYTNLSNLFNGNKVLGDNMNKLLNDNWKEIHAELRPSIEKAFGIIFKSFADRIFGKVPFNDIFITE